MINSQVETTKEIKEFIKDIKYPINSDTLVLIKDLMYSKLEIRPYDDLSREHEKAIRWKRTAGEILKDGYVYDGKACTDLVVLFIALCKALDLETKFVKLKKNGDVHSVAEIKLDGDWYVFDVAYTKSIPRKGPTYKSWQVWKKGRDAWDLGLADFEDIKKIT